MNITAIIPYYEAPFMLQKQLETVALYPKGFEVIIVDDCSSIPAADVLSAEDNVHLYRIDTDIPWNREGARNLGAARAESEWIVHIDIDHVLPVSCARRLMGKKDLKKDRWYRFPRYRVGQADDTRRKDAIPNEQERGWIHPHIDSYLCTHKTYWYVGGYNEGYSGCLGGGGPFLQRMKSKVGEPLLLLEDIYLEVYTKHKIPDASVRNLSRDQSEFARRKRKIGMKKEEKPLRFKWHKVR